jgi:hypothetical protein
MGVISFWWLPVTVALCCLAAWVATYVWARWYLPRLRDQLVDEQLTRWVADGFENASLADVLAMRRRVVH